MMKKINRPEDNEKGFVFIVCILLLFVLTVAGIATVRTSGTEVLTVRNQGQLIREFYNAETGMIDAFENPSPWLLDTDFIKVPPTRDTSGPHNTTVNGVIKATYVLQRIDTNAPVINELPDVPPIQHIGPPPVGEGYSVDKFEIRRYAVTSTSATGNSQVTGGIWKVFNKFK